MAAEETAFPFVPAELRARAASWHTMKRCERRELGQALRALGLSYREIALVIPVSKGTLSGWCRDVELSNEMHARLAAKRPNAVAMFENGKRKRVQAENRRAEIRCGARREVGSLVGDPLWVAGVVAYWSEGAKTSSELRFSNSDPGLIKLFMGWARRYLDVEDFTARLHLHSGQDETERISHWSSVTGIDASRFGKTFVKTEGTGHRKQRLYNGTMSVRATRSSRALQSTLGWMDGLRDLWRSL